MAINTNKLKNLTILLSIIAFAIVLFLLICSSVNNNSYQDNTIKVLTESNSAVDQVKNVMEKLVKNYTETIDMVISMQATQVNDRQTYVKQIKLLENRINELQLEIANINSQENTDNIEKQINTLDIRVNSIENIIAPAVE